MHGAGVCPGSERRLILRRLQRFKRAPGEDIAPNPLRDSRFRSMMRIDECQRQDIL